LRSIFASTSTLATTFSILYLGLFAKTETSQPVSAPFNLFKDGL
jgi:hypothetical protein